MIRRIATSIGNGPACKSRRRAMSEDLQRVEAIISSHEVRAGRSTSTGTTTWLWRCFRAVFDQTEHSRHGRGSGRSRRGKKASSPADGMPVGGDGSGCGGPEQRLELGEDLLDRVQVGRVGRQVEQPGTAGRDRF
jgi:hypothetical protein